jgi:hypothetical protein
MMSMLRFCSKIWILFLVNSTAILHSNIVRTFVFNIHRQYSMMTMLRFCFLFALKYVFRVIRVIFQLWLGTPLHVVEASGITSSASVKNPFVCLSISLKVFIGMIIFYSAIRILLYWVIYKFWQHTNWDLYILFSPVKTI